MMKLGKKIATLAIAAVCACGLAVGFGHTSVKAASSSNYTDFVDNSGDNTTKKIGKYYFTEKNGKYTIKKSKNGSTYYTFKNCANGVSSNGTYAFFVNEKDQGIYRLTIASKKLIRVAKIKGSDGWNLTHVYAGSVYVNDCRSDNSCTIKVYNLGKKTFKTIVKKADVSVVSGSGKYLVYEDYKTGNVLVRNCNSGKTKVVSCMKNTNNIKASGNKVAFTTYDKTEKQYVVKVYNISTGKVKTVKAIGDDSTSEMGDFTDNLSKYTYEANNKNYTLNMKTGKITKK